MKILPLFLVLGMAMPVWSAPKPVAPPAEDRELSKVPVTWPTIRAHDKSNGRFFNSSIAALQFLLRGRGLYRGTVDGIFGAKTVAAIKAFQKSKGLHADGVAGPKTLPLLVTTVKRGSRGDVVRAAQILARDAGDHIGGSPNFGLAVDGVFGKATEEAVKIAVGCALQVEEGDTSKIDGVMRPHSWCLMLGGGVVGDD